MLWVALFLLFGAVCYVVGKLRGVKEVVDRTGQTHTIQWIIPGLQTTVDPSRRRRKPSRRGRGSRRRK